MNYPEIDDDSALSHAGRRPKKCGICFKDFTQHFARHFKKVHPNDHPCVAQWVGGTKHVIVPYKEKEPSARINNEEPASIGQVGDSMLGKRAWQSSLSEVGSEKAKRPKVEEDPDR